jgi:hypothetical protein
MLGAPHSLGSGCRKRMEGHQTHLDVGIELEENLHGTELPKLRGEVQRRFAAPLRPGVWVWELGVS